MASNKEPYKVQFGDTLWSIAEKKLGDGIRWREITRSDGTKFTKETAEDLQTGDTVYLPAKQETKITHREMLTFSNLANLEWQFADLKPQLEEDENGNSIKVYHKLNDILSAPKSFVKTDEDGNVEEYCYGADKEDKGTYLGDEYAKEEMRREAGIAMEYLEKKEAGNEEGSFLEDWEVIYGGDNYKVLDDFFKNLQQANSGQNLDETEKPWPSREKVEQREEFIKNLEMASNCLGIAAKIIPFAVKFKFADEVMDASRLIDLDSLSDDAVNGLKKLSKFEEVERLKKLPSGDAKAWALTLFTKPTKLTNKAVKGEAKEQETEVEKKVSEEELEAAGKKLSKAENPSELEIEEGSIGFIKEIDFRDTGFRVAAFKKDKQIVVAYKRKDIDDDGLFLFSDDEQEEKILPKEFDLLRIVYARLSAKHKECDIKFVSCNQGEELSFLSSLMYEQEASLFYTESISSWQRYVNFTEKDLNKKYQSGKKIVTEGLTNTAVDMSIELVGAILISQGILPGLIFIGGMELIKGFVQYFENRKIEKLYNKLKKDEKGLKDERGLIKEKEKLEDSNGDSFTIKGYITDKFHTEKYLNFTTKEGRSVEIELEDALYFMYKELNDGLDFNDQVKNSLKLDERTGKLEFLSTDKSFELEKNDQGVYKIKRVIYEGETIDEVKVRGRLTTEQARGIIVSKICRKYPNVKEENIYFKDQRAYAKANFDNLKGKALADTLAIISRIQRKYKRKKYDIEYIYFTEKEEEQGSKRLMINTQVPKESKVKKIDSGNEFAFLPYIYKGDKEDGVLRNKLRKDYVMSVFKSAIHHYLEYERVLSAQYGDEKQNSNNQVLQKKYKKKKYIDDRDYNFEGDKVNEKFLHIIKERPQMMQQVFNQKDKLTFNHYQTVIKRVKEKLNNTGMKEMEDYYNYSSGEKKRFVKDEIVINPKAESNLEYKYNPEDYIVGGGLKLMFDNLLGEAAEQEDDAQSGPALKSCFDRDNEEIFAQEPDEVMDSFDTEEADLDWGSEIKEEEVTIPNNSYVKEKSQKERIAKFFNLE